MHVDITFATREITGPALRIDALPGKTPVEIGLAEIEEMSFAHQLRNRVADHFRALFTCHVQIGLVGLTDDVAGIDKSHRRLGGRNHVTIDTRC